MFTLTLTRAEREELLPCQSQPGDEDTLFDLLERLTEHVSCITAPGRFDSDELMTFTFIPDYTTLFLPFLTGDRLKMYSPDLANKLAGLREWIVSLGPAEGA
jgi:hypothetical protein